MNKIALKFGLFLLSALLSLTITPPQTVFAQTGFTVTGTVSDENGETMPGVSVQIKGTLTGTTCDENGEYKINADTDDILIFSFIGMTTQEIPVNGRAVINVTMETDAMMLDEVVAIGYGKQSRTLITNSISMVDEKEFERAPGQNPLMQLQGKVPGLSLEISSGQPGADPKIFIRGGSSTSPEGDAPLIIVDGVISQGFRGITDMNPADIESIVVLKDAASTAIYGARAANGILLVTTKAGSKGKPTVNFRYTFGVEQKPQRLPLLNARDYVYLTRSNTAKFNREELTYNGVANPETFLSGSFGMSTGNPRNSANTLEFLDVYLANYGQDYVSHLLENEGWETMADPVTGRQLIFQDNDFQDATFHTGYKHEVDLNVSGGTDAVHYYVGLRYLNQDGTLRGTSYKNYSILFNGDYKLSEKWKMFTKASLTVRDMKGASNTNNAISRNIRMPPTYRLYYEDGTPAPGEGISSFTNRLYEIYYKTNYSNQVVYRTNFQVGAQWDIIPGLSFKPSFYYFGTEGISNAFEAMNETTGNAIRPASASHGYDRHLQADLLLSYDKKINKHNIGAVAGASWTNDYSYRLEGSGSGAATDLIPTLNATADSTQRVSSTRRYEAMLSYFGRVSYDYDGKYMVSASFRADGSSRFSDGHRWGYFPGVSAGWNMHRENFFRPLDAVVSRWKWRASYGLTGNNNLSIADSRGEYKVTGTPYEGKVGILNTTLKNNDLKWETTESFDVGIDLGFFNDRLNLLVDYYRKLTYDRLYDLPLWSSTGFDSIKSNYGTIRNNGVEIELSATPVMSKNFRWDLSFTFAYNRSIVAELPENGEEKNRIGGNFAWDREAGKEVKVGGFAEGERFGGRWAFHYLGTYQTEEEAALAPIDPNAQSRKKHAGDAIFEDVNNDGVLDSHDMIFMGYIRPDKVGGLVNTLSYKNFTLRIAMDYAIGHVIDNGFKAQIMGSTRNNNNAIDECMTNTWQYAGDGTKYPKYTVQSDYDYQYRNHARWDNQIGNSKDGASNNSLYYSKGDYLAFREVSLSWRLPERWMNKIRMSGMEVFAGAYNLGYIKAYEGMFPEIYTGLDYGTYPRPTQFNVGVNLTF